MLAGVAGAGFLMARSLADDVESLTLLSDGTGASIHDLQVLKQALADMRLPDAIDETALNALNKAIGEANPLLKQLGVTARDPIQALLQLGEAFAASDDAPKKAVIAQALLGKSSRELLGALERLPGVFPKLRTEMESTGQLIDPALVKPLSELDQELETFGHRWDGLMTQIKGSAAKAVNETIDLFKLPGEALKNLPRLNPIMARRGGMLAGPQGAPSTVPTPDLVAGAKVGPEAPKTAREKRLEEIARLLHLTDDQAKATLQTLERFESVEAFEKLRDQVEKARAALRALDDDAHRPISTLDELRKRADTSPIESAQQRRGDERTRELPSASAPVFEPELLFDDFNRGMEEFRQYIAEISNLGNALANTLIGVTEAMSQGIYGIFEAFLFKTKSVGQAIVSLVRGIISEILAQVARLLASKIAAAIVGAIIGGITGGPIGAFVGGGVAAAPIGSPVTFNPVGDRLTVQPSRAAGPTFVTNNYYTENINALTTRDARQTIYGPGGSFRDANRQAAEASAG